MTGSASPENSFILNVFRIYANDPASLLLALYVLAVLHSRFAASREEEIESCFWVVSELAAYFEAAGTSPRSKR